MYKNKIIFIAPLDWGLGHATRCVPLIKKLSIHNTIILGITPLTQLIFDNEFPELKKNTNRTLWYFLLKTITYTTGANIELLEN